MRNKAFTLIELMIVVSIIALLAAIALPKFTAVSEGAKVANVQGNLANLRTSINIFYAKNEAKYPSIAASGSDINTDGNLGTSFQAIYSRTKMPVTPAYGTVTSANTVTSIASAAAFSVQATEGGWLYKDSNGEIHANLNKGAYDDNSIDWMTE